MNNKVLILGATSDIALALAELFAEKQYMLMLAARDISRLQTTKSDLEIRYGATVQLYIFDSLKPETHATFYEQLEEWPDIVVCVFGYLGDHAAAMKDWSECYRILFTNYVGAVSILNIIANDFEERRQGTIVGISSVAGERGRQSNYFYGSAKAGFTAYLSGLRNRLFKSNVHVLTVKPGFVRTRMIEGIQTPAPLTAQPRQVAAQVFNAIRKKKNVIYALPLWKWIMWIIRNIPEGIFKKLKL